MTIAILQKNKKTLLIIVAILLFTASIIVHEMGDFTLYRMIRGIICFVFLGILLLFTGKHTNKLVVFFFIFYGTSSIATIWYEINTVATLAMALNFISVLFLIRAVWPKVDFRKMNALFTIIFIALALFNAYLLYEFLLMIKDFTLSNIHYAFTLMGAMGLVILAFLTFLYNYTFSSNSSILFLFFVFIILFSEIFRAIGYYNFAYGDIAVFIARGLLIVSLGLLVYYETLAKKNEERLNTRLF